MSPKAKPPTFTQRHAESISKLKLVLIVVCLIAIPLSFWLTHEDVGSVNNRVTKIESPCNRYGPDSKVCQEAFETAVKSITHRIACYIDHESGRPFKPSCIGVHLRIETPVPKLGGSSAGKSGEAPSRGSNGGDASTGTSPHSPSGPSPGGPTDTPSKSHGPSVPHQSPHGHESGGGEAPAASPTQVPSSSPSQPPTSTVERSTETVVVQPPAPAPEAEPPARTATGGLVEGVGAVVEGVGTTVEETGHGLNEVVGDLGCQLLHTC